MEEESLSAYDVVVHVAGIAHRKETKENAPLYYQINRDLAVEIAKKAKRDGVGHFIYLSSMSVYGLEQGVIDEHTPLNPTSNYGKSKLQAEELIGKIASTTFKIATLRPPMIYGKGCKGNYQRLRKLALKTPVFPDVDNKRSMIYIDNLSEFLKILIDDSIGGLFCPQNKEYVRTSEMVKEIANVHEHKIKTTAFLNPLLRLFNVSVVNKVFGDLVYDKKLADYTYDYQIKEFVNSVVASEREE